MGSLVVQMLGLHDLFADHYQSGISFLKSSVLQDYETAILDQPFSRLELCMALKLETPAG
jgi:hypothetical protein